MCGDRGVYSVVGCVCVQIEVVSRYFHPLILSASLARLSALARYRGSFCLRSSRVESVNNGKILRSLTSHALQDQII